MAEHPGEQAPADDGAQDPDPLTALDGIEDVPLDQQVEVFQTIHDQLADRLDRAES